MSDHCKTAEDVSSGYLVSVWTPSVNLSSVAAFRRRQVIENETKVARDELTRE